MRVLIFSVTFVWNIFHSKKNCTRYDKKLVLVFKLSTSYSCPILMKLEFSGQIFEKYSNIKVIKIRPIGTEFYPCGQTDIRWDMTKVIVAFRNFANAHIKNDHSNAMATMLTKHHFYAVKPLNSSTNNVVIFIKDSMYSDSDNCYSL